MMINNLIIAMEEQNNQYLNCISCFFEYHFIITAMASSNITCNVCNIDLKTSTFYCCNDCSIKIKRCKICGNSIGDYNYELFKLDKVISQCLENYAKRIE